MLRVGMLKRVVFFAEGTGGVGVKKSSVVEGVSDGEIFDLLRSLSKSCCKGKHVGDDSVLKLSVDNGYVSDFLSWNKKYLGEMNREAMEIIDYCMYVSD